MLVYILAAYLVFGSALCGLAGLYDSLWSVVLCAFFWPLVVVAAIGNYIRERS